MMISDRIAGVVSFIISLLMLFLCFGLEEGIATGVVGAKGFPAFLASLGLLLGGNLILFPNKTFKPTWADSNSYIWVVALMIVLIFYGYALEWFGFVLSSVVFMFLVLKIFGNNHKTSFVLAIASTLFIYLLFDTILEISLPIGDIIRTWRS